MRLQRSGDSAGTETGQRRSLSVSAHQKPRRSLSRFLMGLRLARRDVYSAPSAKNRRSGAPTSGRTAHPAPAGWRGRPARQYGPGPARSAGPWRQWWTAGGQSPPRFCLPSVDTGCPEWRLPPRNPARWWLRPAAGSGRFQHHSGNGDALALAAGQLYPRSPTCFVARAGLAGSPRPKINSCASARRAAAIISASLAPGRP